MKKERLFYLDFIRAIATIAIVLTHFNAIYLYLQPQRPEVAVITTMVSNIYIGNWGVSLFFIISGASLMYVYENKCELKTFYKKRFLSIYPMFWIAYSIDFLYQFYLNKGGFNSAPKWRIILSVIGFDGYLSANMRTFYLLGEWFLGAIILIYFIFPFLRKMVNQYPWVLIAVVSIIYIYIILFYDLPFNKSLVIFTRLPEIIMGMCFVKYIKKVKWPVALISMIVLILNQIIKPSLDDSLQTTYIGIASFFVLVFVSNYMKFRGIEYICSVLSKYSYAIFLVHHVVIVSMAGTFNLQEIQKIESYVLFIACGAVIALFSYLLYRLHDAIMKQILPLFQTKKQEVNE